MKVWYDIYAFYSEEYYDDTYTLRHVKSIYSSYSSSDDIDNEYLQVCKSVWKWESDPIVLSLVKIVKLLWSKNYKSILNRSAFLNPNGYHWENRLTGRIKAYIDKQLLDDIPENRGDVEICGSIFIPFYFEYPF